MLARHPVLAEAGRELDGGTVVIVVDAWQQMGRFERMIQLVGPSMWVPTT